MTDIDKKREQIREIDKQIVQAISLMMLEVDFDSDDPKDDLVLVYHRCAREIRARLDKLGVVIKVDREFWVEVSEGRFEAVAPLIDEVICDDLPSGEFTPIENPDFEQTDKW